MSEETIPELRDARDEAVADAKRFRTERDDSQKEVRELKAREAFHDAGYEKGHGELFVAVNPETDFTAEAIAEFVKENNLPPRAQETSSKSEEKPGEEKPTETGEEKSEETSGSGLSTMSGGGSGAGGGGQQSTADELVTTAEWAALHKSNPEAARKVVKEGRVKLRTDNPYGVPPS